MSPAIAAPLVALLLVGCVLLLADMPWFRQRPLVDRLRPYCAGTAPHQRRHPGPATLTQVLGPIAHSLGARLSRALGVTTDLGRRLEVAGSDLDPQGFRLRQLAHAIAALAAGGSLVLWWSPNVPVALVVVLGTPALTLLLHEQRLSAAGSRRRRRLHAELPVVVEQLGLLLSAGYSLTSALTRLSRRTNGVAAEDLRRVLLRIRHGLTEHAALAEWAESSELEAVDRLTRVLALHREAGDLGLLISEEARAVRAESQRELIETIERRAQLVWIPVTVATLVPGLVFLAVPFVSAMSRVTGG